MNKESPCLYFTYFKVKPIKKKKAGKYVWSPQKNKSGGANAGYTTMTQIREGDFILHNSNGKLVAISIARKDCRCAEQPQELINAIRFNGII